LPEHGPPAPHTFVSSHKLTRRQPMTNPVQQNTSPIVSQDRAQRLEALRHNLDACIDEIVTARADRAADLKKEFDAAWKQLGAEVDATLH
jgi:hypothetical protein